MEKLCMPLSITLYCLGVIFDLTGCVKFILCFMLPGACF